MNVPGDEIDIFSSSSSSWSFFLWITRFNGCSGSGSVEVAWLALIFSVNSCCWQFIVLLVIFLEELVIVSGFFSKVCVGKNDKKGLNISLDESELDLATEESSQGLKQGVFLFSDAEGLLWYVETWSDLNLFLAGRLIGLGDLQSDEPKNIIGSILGPDHLSI